MKTLALIGAVALASVSLWVVVVASVAVAPFACVGWLSVKFIHHVME